MHKSAWLLPYGLFFAFAQTVWRYLESLRRLMNRADILTFCHLTDYWQ